MANWKASDYATEGLRMGIPKGYRTIAAVVPEAIHDALMATATAQDTSVSKIVASILQTGLATPVVPAKRIHRVRAYKDELMLSLPMDFVRRAGLRKRSCLVVSFGPQGLIATPK